VITIRARDIMAGDSLVVKEGRIRKYYHVCEVSKHRINYKWYVEIIYNGRGGEFIVTKLRGIKKIQVREEY
jgi:hypothetical protein